MKRLPILIFTALVFTLSACDKPQPLSADFEGNWSGSTTTGSATVPMSFELGRDGRVVEDSFNASYESELLSFTITSYAVGRSLTVEATASTSAGDHLTFVLTGLVEGDVITGQYRLDVTIGASTTSFEGHFELERVEPR